MRPRRALLALTAAIGCATTVEAEPIPLGESFRSVRMRTEMRQPEGGPVYGWNDIELSRKGERLLVRWAFTTPAGAVKTEEVATAILDGHVRPLSTLRVERDADGHKVFELRAKALAASRGEVVIETIDADGDYDTDEIDVDEPPLYPSILAGSLFHALVDEETDALRFSILVEYPWSWNSAMLGATITGKVPATSEVVDGRTASRVLLKPDRSWLVDMAIRMFGIRDEVLFDVADAPGRPSVRFEGPISWRSGVVHGEVVAFRLLEDGERLPTWPPPREGYGPDAMPVVDTPPSPGQADGAPGSAHHDADRAGDGAPRSAHRTNDELAEDGVAPDPLDPGP